MNMYMVVIGNAPTQFVEAKNKNDAKKQTKGVWDHWKPILEIKKIS